MGGSGTTRVFVPHCGWVVMPEGDDVTRRVREGWFETSERALWTLMLREGDTVVDAGAHAGLYSVLAATLVGESGRVLAVEPNGSLAAMLRENLTGSPSAKVVNAALWSHDGGVSLKGDERGPAYGSVAVCDGEEGQAVEGLTLATLLSVEGIEGAAILKLDIEGSELEALRGAGALLESKSIGVVMVELTRSVLERSGRSASETLGPLMDAGYAAMRFDADGLRLVTVDLGALGEHENLFVCADPEEVNARIASADPERVGIAQDMIARGDAVRRLADASVERGHLFGVVEGLRADLAAAHEALARQRERSDAMLMDQEREIGDASAQWEASREALSRTIGSLNESLEETQQRWAESDKQYAQALRGMRGELDQTHGVFERAQSEWETARTLYEETIESLRAQLVETHEKWAQTREAYESTLSAMRPDRDGGTGGGGDAGTIRGGVDEAPERSGP